MGDVDGRAVSVERRVYSHVDQHGKAKVYYPTRAIAKVEARRVRGTGGPALHEYPCAECPGWHLGKGRTNA